MPNLASGTDTGLPIGGDHGCATVPRRASTPGSGVARPGALPDVAGAAGPLDPRACPDWDSTVLANPDARVFHTRAWVSVLAETYGYRPVYLTRRGSGGTFAALPLMEVRSRLTGCRGVSLPFTDECASLAASEDERGQLFSDAVALGRARRWKYLECRGGLGHTPGARPSTRFWGHRLRLDRDEDRLLKRCQPSVRRALSKARKSGVTVEVASSLAGARAYYGLHCLTRQRHGLPPQPFNFFSNIYRLVIEPGSGTILLARWQDKLVAGAVFLNGGQTAIYKFGASDDRYQAVRANNLVMWEGIVSHARRGFASLEFGRTSLGHEGLREYKLGWGTEEYDVTYFRYHFTQNAFVEVADQASGWHNRVFRRLPVTVSRWIGKALYGHLG